MTLVVGGITAGAIHYARSAAAAAAQARLQTEFQGEMGWLVGSEEARREAIAERCRSLARSVRILAALEEGEVEDLYRNADVELRDVREHKGLIGDGLPRLLRARGYRFLDGAGNVIPRSTETVGAAAAWTAQLGLDRLPDEQENGYVALSREDGDAEIHEVIVTPVINPESGEAIAALALFFPPVQVRADRSRELKGGILLGGRVFTEAGEPGIAAAMLTAADAANTGKLVQSDGVPYMAFSNLLNPGSAFPAAKQICLYPISASLEQHKHQQWKIAGTGAAVLIAGFIVSLLLSSRLSKPIERLVEDSAENIAQRQRAEAERDLTERKYQSIFENAIEGLCVLSGDGRFLSLNPALAVICGFDAPASVLAALPESAAPLYATPQQFHDFLAAVRAAGSVSDFEMEMIRPDGRRIFVSHNARCVPDAESGGVRFEGSMEDVTDRKRAADELRTLNAGLERALHDLRTTQQQVIQQERLRALGEMASGVAHDFNNALTPILGYSELLLRRGESLDPAEKISYLESINTAASDAGTVVSRLREFYRSTAAGDVFSAVDLSQLVRQTVTLTQPRWKDQARSRGVTINVVTEFGENVRPVSGVAASLREMLTNLVFNAVDAMPSGGTITLRTRGGDAHTTLEVIDTGTGMTDEVRQRCLEPFFSTKGERGTGLGLSMCFGIIQRHGGTLGIESEPGCGTKFIISLPAVRESEAPESPAAHLAAPAGARALSVLVVDDEKPIRLLLHAMLRSDGHHVALAEQGDEALQIFGGSEFDLVITDKSMPGMNGDQLATAVKQVSPGTPVILLTGFGQFLDRSEVPDADVIASKPISLQSLRDAIAAATACGPV
jgi:PAS domain S-box-containing protein